MNNMVALKITSVLVGVGGPDQIERLAKGLVPPSERRVDDILAVARDSHEPATRAVSDGLGEDLARAELLVWQRQLFSIVNFLLYVRNQSYISGICEAYG